MPVRSHDRPLILLGGASGTGKSLAARRMSAHFGIPVSELDDIVLGIKAMTTYEQQPALHYWSTHFAEASGWAPEKIVDLTLEVSRAVGPALEAVVLDHLECRTPVVLEGDYIHPEIAARFDLKGRVLPVFLYEDNEEQLVKNYLKREPDNGRQVLRARVSQLLGVKHRELCRELGLVAIPARPWTTQLQRAIAAWEGSE